MNFQPPQRPAMLVDPEHSIEELLELEPLIIPDLIEFTRNESQGMDLVTKDFRGDTVRRHVNIPSEEDPNKRPGQWSLHVFFCTPRDILWPYRERGHLKDCIMDARPVFEYGQDAKCCRLMSGHLLTFKAQWMNGLISRRLNEVLRGKGERMRRIETIVCYQFGSLVDRQIGQINRVSLVRHLTAYTIANILNEVQPPHKRPDGRPIRLIAEDYEYCSGCVDFLQNKISLGESDAVGVKRTSGFEFVTKQLECFSGEYLNHNTMFINFGGRSRDSALAPAMNLTAKLTGPAALLCPLVTNNGLDAPTMAAVAAGDTHIDSSPELCDWVEHKAGIGNAFPLDDWQEQKCLQGLGYEIGTTKFAPMLYWAE